MILLSIAREDMSCTMRKSDFCMCENEAADDLCSNCTADQCLSSSLMLNFKLLAFWRVFVGPGWKPEDQFSHVVARIYKNNFSSQNNISS